MWCYSFTVLTESRENCWQRTAFDDIRLFGSRDLKSCQRSAKNCNSMQKQNSNPKASGNNMEDLMIWVAHPSTMQLDSI
jgi:hypothetical protein